MAVNHAEELRDQKTAADENGGDDGGAAQQRHPGDLPRHVAAGENGHERQHRDRRHVLKQQHSKGVASGDGGQQAALVQHGQHDGGGGEGEADPENAGAGPGNAAQV